MQAHGEIKHIPALDGVRGVAILLVMFFHLKIPGFSLGWSGVPLFFVLSGFLITRILIEGRDARLSEYLRVFYLKRTLRIFPLFYAYILVNFIFLLALNRPTEGYAWYLVYLQNYHIGRQLFEAGNIPGMVAHTWSLAVEEQFYLIWPFIIYFLGRRSLVWVCALLIVVAPISRYLIVAMSDNVYMANVTLLSCLDMMAYGALIAFFSIGHFGARIVYSLFVVGCALLMYSISKLGLDAFWNPQDWVRYAPYMFTALAFVFGLPVWLLANDKGKLLARFMEFRVFAFTGKISYGLYVWHFVLFIVMEKAALKYPSILSYPVTVLCSLMLAYIVSIASYYLFEVHFLRLKDKFSQSATVPSLPDATR
ncbi:acyltransferase [Pseudomonas sp. L5B5]|uniref:acyltransferase family protein n=1 Tax=Pseudomonas sp. L5B5 TaxID=2883205 RepID=UPI001CF9A3F4|nr:acyltransferase [Pseudomonas sp. L5B5]UCZ84165.1 acyltransferase [Pseudomonas sp. L5B5]